MRLTVRQGAAKFHKVRDLGRLSFVVDAELCSASIVSSPLSQVAMRTAQGCGMPDLEITRTRYLPISMLTCRNGTHWCAVGGSVEHPCAAKKAASTIRPPGPAQRLPGFAVSVWT